LDKRGNPPAFQVWRVFRVRIPEVFALSAGGFLFWSKPMMDYPLFPARLPVRLSGIRCGMSFLPDVGFAFHLHVEDFSWSMRSRIFLRSSEKRSIFPILWFCMSTKRSSG